MNDSNPATFGRAGHRAAWNKGKLTGAKPPRPGHVWAIRARLHLGRRTRDLAMFNFALDSKLRGCDLVASTTWRPTDTPSIGRASGKGRPVDRSGSS